MNYMTPELFISIISGLVVCGEHTQGAGVDWQWHYGCARSSQYYHQQGLPITKGHV